MAGATGVSKHLEFENSWSSIHQLLIHLFTTMSSTDQLPALFGELERFVSQADYDKALKMCDKILNIASDDQDALHCKLITLIRLERYSDALALLARKFKGENKFLFERAYCLYRSNQLTQALEVIETAKKANQQDVATRHLEAQLVRLVHEPFCFL